MEKKKCSVKEALTFMFQEGWVIKAIGAILLYCPFIFMNILFYYSPLKVSVFTIIYEIIALLITIFGMITVWGYVELYVHDRALDKNAKWRNWTECIMDAFWAGLKSYLGAFTVAIIVWIISFIAILAGGALGAITIVPLAMASPVFALIGGILGFALYVSYIIFIICFMVKLKANYVKDLKLSSWFKWKEAFRLTAGVPIGPKAILTGVALFVGYFVIAMGIIFISVPNLLSMSKEMQAQVALPPLATILITVIAVYFTLYWQNIFGQFTYNAIEQNFGVEPETMPKEINQDKKVAAIIGILLVVIPLLIVIIAAPFIKKAAAKGMIKSNSRAGYSTEMQLPQNYNYNR